MTIGKRGRRVAPEPGMGPVPGAECLGPGNRLKRQSEQGVRTARLFFPSAILGPEDQVGALAAV